MKFQWFRCFIGLHKKKVLKEIVIKDNRGDEIGMRIVTQCENCGKIQSEFISFVGFVR